MAPGEGPAGWEVVHRGEADRALNGLGSPPSGARTRQVLMGNIGADTGLIRMIEVAAANQKPNRSRRVHNIYVDSHPTLTASLGRADMSRTSFAILLAL